MSQYKRGTTNVGLRRPILLVSSPKKSGVHSQNSISDPAPDDQYSPDLIFKQPRQNLNFFLKEQKCRDQEYKLEQCQKSIVQDFQGTNMFKSLLKKIPDLDFREYCESNLSSVLRQESLTDELRPACQGLMRFYDHWKRAQSLITKTQRDDRDAIPWLHAAKPRQETAKISAFDELFQHNRKFNQYCTDQIASKFFDKIDQTKFGNVPRGSTPSI
jgi:hypothetical protein